MMTPDSAFRHGHSLCKYCHVALSCASMAEQSAAAAAAHLQVRAVQGSGVMVVMVVLLRLVVAVVLVVAAVVYALVVAAVVVAVVYALVVVQVAVDEWCW